MLSRLAYTLRETWASFRRNMTLTVAAIITSAVSLLIFGLTLLMQRGFDNLLVQWEGDVEMIVYVNAGATDAQRA
jgi:cell division transport system permease protein